MSHGHAWLHRRIGTWSFPEGVADGSATAMGVELRVVELIAPCLPILCAGGVRGFELRIRCATRYYQIRHRDPILPAECAIKADHLAEGKIKLIESCIRMNCDDIFLRCICPQGTRWQVSTTVGSRLGGTRFTVVGRGLGFQKPALPAAPHRRLRRPWVVCRVTPMHSISLAS